MKPVYRVWSNQHEPVAWGFVENHHNITGIYVPLLHRGAGHGRALVASICREADRERRRLVVVFDHELDEFLAKFGFKDNIREWQKID